MKRHRLFLVLVLLLVVGGLLLVPTVRWPIYGWLRGEAFYQGMPTSWWSHVLAVEDLFSISHKPGTPPQRPGRTIMEILTLRDGSWGNPLPFSPEAIPMLAELLSHPAQDVRSRASAILLSLVRPGSDDAADLTNARKAIPALTKALGSSDAEARGAARESLQAIDPEAAAKAGIK